MFDLSNFNKTTDSNAAFHYGTALVTGGVMMIVQRELFLDYWHVKMDSLFKELGV